MGETSFLAYGQGFSDGEYESGGRREMRMPVGTKQFCLVLVGWAPPLRLNVELKAEICNLVLQPNKSFENFEL